MLGLGLLRPSLNADLAIVAVGFFPPDPRTSCGIGLAEKLQFDTGDEFPDGGWLDDEIARTDLKSDNSANLRPRSVQKSDWELLPTPTSLPKATSAAREAVRLAAASGGDETKR